MSLLVFSLFPSSKKGDDVSVETAKKIVASVKKGRIGFLEQFYTDKISDKDKIELHSFISSNATLVPIPKSAPLVENAVWANRDVCDFLVSKGLGNLVYPLLKRIKAVPKAAFQNSSEERPSVKTHYDSILLEDPKIFASAITNIVLVDDVVTQSRTAYACFQKLRDKFPDIPIKLFSLIRSDSFHKITTWNAPMASEINYNPNSGKTFHNMEPNPLNGLWDFLTT